MDKEELNNITKKELIEMYIKLKQKCDGLEDDYYDLSVDYDELSYEIEELKEKIENQEYEGMNVDDFIKYLKANNLYTNKLDEILDDYFKFYCE